MKKSAIAVVVTLMSATAFAQSVKEKKAWDKIAEEAKAASTSLKESCGVDITFVHDKKSWNTVELAEGPARFCISEGESAIRGLCGDADYKAAVAKSIKKVNCTNDDKLPNNGSTEANGLSGNKFSLKGGVFDWRYNSKSSNMSDQATTFLKSAL